MVGSTELYSAGVYFLLLCFMYITRHNGCCPDPKGNLHAEKVPEWVNSSARDKKEILCQVWSPLHTMRLVLTLLSSQFLPFFRR